MHDFGIDAPSVNWAQAWLIGFIAKMWVLFDGVALEYIPKKSRTLKRCLKAVSTYGKALEFVPEELKTKEMCEIAVKQNGWALDYVPEEFLTEELVLMSPTFSAIPVRMRTHKVVLSYS